MSVSFTATIGGQTILANDFEVTGSTFGSVGHASIMSSITALGGLDLFDLTTTSVGITEVYITASIDGASTRLFGGEHLMTTWDFDNDTVTIQARSWAGILVDQKRVLSKIGAATQAAFTALAPGRISAAGISNENQKVGAIVTAIAQEFGLTPVLNMTNGNPTIGTLYGSGSQTFMPVPQSLWNILNQLARDTGYVVYDTPDKQLVLGEPGAGVPTVALGYESPTATAPMRAFRIEHHPRQNSTFRVLVVSYDPSKCAINLGRASYVGRNFAGSAGLQSGLSTGSQAAANDTALAKLGSNSTQVPLYTFHHDGLTADQAQTLAAAITTDIAKRELILSGTIEGMPGLVPAQKVTVGGNVPGTIGSTTFYISGYNHRFRMPKPHQHDANAGFVTQIKALNIPTDALANENAG
jgi:hypothetical protein